MMVFSLVACSPASETPETTVSDTSIESTVETPDSSVEEAPDINANAVAILEEMIGQRIGDSNFIDVVLAHVPDVFMLKEYRCACWTYFLVMSDGIEYIVITDYNGKITSIAEWLPESEECGIEFYSDPPTEE
jgi:hypothetical protein